MSNDTASVVNSLTGQAIADEELQVIAKLAQAQLDYEQKIKVLEDQLEAVKDNLKVIMEERLPNAMLAIGLESFKLRDGSSVEIHKFYQGKIPEGMEDAAFKWLRDNEFDAIIKRQFKLDFGKGEDENAEKLKKLLIKNKFEFADKQGVHAMTMKAFIREQVEAGHALPTDLLGVYVGNRSKVTPAKK